VSRKTPLGQVLGLGSAKDGTSHWWTQRLSAIALVPLGLWFAFSVAALAASGGLDYATVTGWMRSPWRAVLLVALVIVVAYHSMLGMQVVIEDYVRGGPKVASLIAMKLAHFILGLAGVIAALRVSFGA
jgi:succinate dehydrogenase / fumarate reductase membrane anchor subunit